jgi:hypothetical protein
MGRTSSAVSVDLDDLLSAIEWASAGVSFGTAAYIRRNDGCIFWVGDDAEEIEGFPTDIDDESRYVALPSKRELGLAKPLALRFASEHLESDVDEVDAIFHGPGAYQRFKRLLERRHRLEDWYDFEASETKDAITRWMREHGFEVRICGESIGDV